MCGDLPDPKNAGIVHHIFGVCRETEAERDCRLHLLLSAAHPEAASDRKLGGLGSKLHLVSEENAAFVSFCMCRIFTVSVSGSVMTASATRGDLYGNLSDVSGINRH